MRINVSKALKSTDATSKEQAELLIKILKKYNVQNIELSFTDVEQANTDFLNPLMGYIVSIKETNVKLVSNCKAQRDLIRKTLNTELGVNTL